MFIVLQILGIFAFLVFIFVSLLFLLATWLKNNSIIDIAYGPIFAFATIGTMIITKTYSALPIFMATCVCIWAFRLSLRILFKNIGKPEDSRYAAWRNKWMIEGKRYFLIRSYFQIFILQGIIICVVAMPIIVSIAAGDALLFWVVIPGAIIFVIGLLYETIADLQIDMFIYRKMDGLENSVIMTKGLFKYSRRPNYFGETLVWWGMAIMTLSLPVGYIAFVSPLLITYIVTKVTGPMLEEIFLEKYPIEYREYMRKTNYFIPFFPKA